MTDPDLIRFIDAQAPVYGQVVAELTAGRKRTHWMWFVFPQLDGLGHSAMASRYAIGGLDQARRYLADPVLGERLREATRLMLRHAGTQARQILGSPDDMKLRSSLTLFREAAADDEDRTLFSAALGAFHGGEADPLTLDLLRRG
jgi:uncharacterized protein (DUF1810 family)